MALTALDVVVLLLVGGGAILGGLRGFVSEVLSLFAWVAAVIALKFLYAPVADWTMHVTHSVGGAAVLAFALVFLVVFFAGKWVAASLGARVRRSLIGPFDRLLGVGFGALKGVLIATLLFLVITLGYDVGFGNTARRPAWLQGSRSYPLLDASSRAVIAYVEHRRRAAAGPAK